MANDSEDLKGIRQDIKDLDSKQDHQTEISDQSTSRYCQDGSDHR